MRAGTGIDPPIIDMDEPHYRGNNQGTGQHYEAAHLIALLAPSKDGIRRGGQRFYITVMGLPSFLGQLKQTAVPAIRPN